MRNTRYNTLALALTLALAPCAHAWSKSIPLDVIRENFGNSYAYRLGINVGVNGATPKEYLFDTGSDSFNIDVGLSALNGAGPSWFPTQPGTATGPLQFYLYGDGTYGYLQSSTTVSSMQFYDSSSGSQVADYATNQGAPVAANYAYVTTQASGQVVGVLPDGQTLKIDQQFQRNLDNGVAPEEGAFYGIFGAGDFGNGVPGMLSQSGYIVEANGNGDAPGICKSACLIEGLTPALRAQFLTEVPWTHGAYGAFPISGANSASQFATEFVYTLSKGGQLLFRATYPTLFDTGTPSIVLIDNNDGIPPGSILNPGITLTATGAVAGAHSTSIVSGNPSGGDQSNVVEIGPYGGFPNSAIYGISFFFHNAVLYDLANQATGYTPFFVTEASISNSLDVTSSMGPLGLAGPITGDGTLQVDSGGIANLSGADTYTGATRVASGGWLGLAGPGSIADSSNVLVDGVLDISRSSQTSDIRSLSGSGGVALGHATLNLTAADGTFSGDIADGGLGGGSGGHLIISGGTETLSGENSFSGPTGITGPAALDLSSSGSLAGSVVNMGTFLDNGSVAGSVINAGLLSGNGTIGGDLFVSGMVAPGQVDKASYEHLDVAGDYVQTAGSIYTAQIDLAHPGSSSRVNIEGQASLASGAQLHVTAPAAIYQPGTGYTLLSATQGIQGMYALDGGTSLTPVLGFSPVYAANSVSVDVVQTRLLPGFAHTSNQHAVLASVQGLPAGSMLFDVLASQRTATAIRDAGNQLSGEIYGTIQNALLENSQDVRDASRARLHQAVGDATVAGPSVQPGANGSAWWGELVGAWMHEGSDGNAASSKGHVGGFLVGHDVALNQTARLGFTAGVTQTSVSVNHRGSSAHGNTVHLGVYAGSRMGAFGLSGGLAYSRDSISLNRLVTLPYLVDYLDSRYDASTTQVFAEINDPLAFKRSTFEPFLQAAYVRLSTDSLHERGGVQAVHSNGERHGTSFSTLGVRASTEVGSSTHRITLHGMLGWRHAYGYVTPVAQLAFSGGSSFNVYGLPIAQNALVAQAGMTARISRSSQLDLSYQGQAGQKAIRNSLRLGFNWAF